MTARNVAASPTAAAAPSADPLSAAAAAAKPGDPHRDPAMEKDVWQGRPSWRANYGSWAIWLVVTVTVLILTYKNTEPQSPWRSPAWLLVSAAAVALFVRQALVIYGESYRITSQRLFLYRGIVTRVTDQLELVRAEDVRLKQGLIDRLVDTGQIEVISSDATDEKIHLKSVADPHRVVEHLRRNVRGARGKGSLFVENV